MKRLLIALVACSVLAGCDDSGDLQKHVSGTYTCSDSSKGKFPADFNIYIRQGLRSAEYLDTVYKDPSISNVGGGGFFGHGLGYNGKMYMYHTEMPDGIFNFNDYLENENGEVNIQIYKKNIFDLVNGWFKGDFSSYTVFGSAMKGKHNYLSGLCFKEEAQ